MKINIYGAEGCRKCSKLKEKTQEVINEKEVDAEVEKVTNPAGLAEKGLMSTPAFEIDDEVIFQGSSPPKDHLAELILERL